MRLDFSSERVLSFLHVLGGLFLIAAPFAAQPACPALDTTKDEDNPAKRGIYSQNNVSTATSESWQ